MVHYILSGRRGHEKKDTGCRSQGHGLGGWLNGGEGEERRSPEGPRGSSLLTWQMEGCFVLSTAAITLKGDTRAAHEEAYSRGPETSTWGCQGGSLLRCKEGKGTPNSQANVESRLGSVDVQRILTTFLHDQLLHACSFESVT